MTKIGIGLPGLSIAEARHTAAVAVGYEFDSFSVYGDLGDLPPYAVLHSAADTLRGSIRVSTIPHVGPMGIPVGMQHPEVIAQHAKALEEQLPGQTYLGLVRGAFVDSIGERPATLTQVKDAVEYVRTQCDVPIYLGGFGKRLLELAGNLNVDGVKLGGTTNVELAKKAIVTINNPEVKVILGAVSVIDRDRKAARALARREVAKYLAVVGRLDTTLDADDLESLTNFESKFHAGNPHASKAISDSLLDKFAIAGTTEDAKTILKSMHGVVERFEFGTPHGLADRVTGVTIIGECLAGKSPKVRYVRGIPQINL